MRTLKIFRWLSHFLLIYMIGTCVMYGITFLPEIVKENQPLMLVKFLGDKIPIEKNGIYIKIFIITCYVIYLVYVYAIILFNLCVLKFEKKIFFHVKNINMLKKIGYIFIINYIIVFLIGKIFSIELATTNTNLFLYNNFSKPVLKELESPLGGLLLGLLFLTLSKVFEIAKNQKEENIELKQENELTI